MADLIARVLIEFIHIATTVLYYVIFLWVIMSWLTHTRTRLGHLLDDIVYPLVRPFWWARLGGLDLSPIVVLFLLRFIQRQAPPLILALSQAF